MALVPDVPAAQSTSKATETPRRAHRPAPPDVVPDDAASRCSPMSCSTLARAPVATAVLVRGGDDIRTSRSRWRDGIAELIHLERQGDHLYGGADRH